jgi:hypothetical protein
MHRIAALILLITHSAQGGVLLRESFDQQGAWQKNIKGEGTIQLVQGGVSGTCLKVATGANAMVYYSLHLDPARVRGKRLFVRAKVKLENVTLGLQSYSTAKIHIGATVAGKVQNFAQRFLGTRDWHDQVLAAEIPKDATGVVLDLGIQNGNGTAWFDDLVVHDGETRFVCLDLRPVANASHAGTAFVGGGIPALDALPSGLVQFADVDFRILHPQENYGRTCVVLRGAKRPDLPARIDTVIPVGAKAAKLVFLQAAAWPQEGRCGECLTYTIQFDDGRSIDAPIRECLEVGSVLNPRERPNWKLAWTAEHKAGRLGLGVCTWENPHPETAIRWIRLSTPGRDAVPIVLAISLEPPK